jgi:hypothetical protein
VRPLHLQDIHKGYVQLIEECALLSEAFFGVGGLDNEVYDEVANAWMYQSVYILAQ